MDKKRREKGLYWDRAWSLIKGCTPVSPACDYCWLATETNVRASHPNLSIQRASEGLVEHGHFNGDIRLMEGSLGLPLRVKKPTVWAVWSDLFHETVPEEFIDKAFTTMALLPQHTFLILTKRPQKMLNWHMRKALVGSSDELVAATKGEWPLRNVYLGATVENQQAAEERIPILLQIPAAKRFVSVEPLLGPVALNSWMPSKGCVGGTWLDSVVIGCESGPHARETKTEWIRDVKNQCVAAGVPVLIKQARIEGKLVKLPEIDGKVWNRLPWDKEGR